MVTARRVIVCGVMWCYVALCGVMWCCLVLNGVMWCHVHRSLLTVFPVVGRVKITVLKRKLPMFADAKAIAGAV
jgi:hypothetical protein